jgi:pimeloyl-ACP methyl ester carboxylesterase
MTDEENILTTVPADSLRPTRIRSITANGVGLQMTDRDRTRPFLLLHGGAGTASMTGFADLLAQRLHTRVLLPTHPGFDGTGRPASLVDTKDLAQTYVALLDDLDLVDVTLIGNSFGGWVAAEMALTASPRVSGIVIVNGVGIDVPGHPVANLVGLSPAERTRLSVHDPAHAPGAPATAGPAGPASGMTPGIEALAAYTGPTGSDPTLRDRLSKVDIPAHVIWGASDGIVDLDYGKAFADAFPLSTFTTIPGSGHFPQIETPEELLGAILDLGR